MELYIICAIASMVLYGFTAIIYKVASPSIDSVSLTLFTSAFITAVVFVYWVFAEHKVVTLRGLEYAGLAGLIGAVAFIMFITAIASGKVSVATTLRGLSFAVTVSVAILFLSEQVTTLKMFGIALAVISMILLSV